MRAAVGPRSSGGVREFQLWHWCLELLAVLVVAASASVRSSAGQAAGAIDLLFVTSSCAGGCSCKSCGELVAGLSPLIEMKSSPPFFGSASCPGHDRRRSVFSCYLGVPAAADSTPLKRIRFDLLRRRL